MFMKFPLKDSLADDEVQQGLSSVIKDGLATQMMVTLTGGVFLVAFALKLGASNTMIGVLAAIPPLMNLIQIPGIYLIEKYRLRKTIVVYAAAISRIFLLLMAAIPFFFSLELGIGVLLLALMIHSAFAALGGSSWNSWMRDLLPQESLGSFFSKRMTYAAALGIVLSLSAGVYIDWWVKTYPEQELYGYSLLFFLGFLAGMVGVYFLSTIPEPRMEPKIDKTNFRSMFIKPFKDINFRNLIVFSSSWAFAVNLAAPFFTVYMLNRLNLEMSYIIAFLVLSQIMNLAFLRIWGRFSDQFSNKSVLSVSGPLFIFCILAWTFTTLPEKHIFTIPLLIAIHIFMGISTAGVALASGNIGLKLAPKGEAASYLTANNVVNSIVAGIAPVLGGQFADYFAQRQLSLELKWLSPNRELVFQTLNFQQWDFFFFLAFLIGLYSIHRLALVKEKGEVGEKIVIKELISEVRKETRNLSTVSGIRYMFYLPVHIVRKTKRLKNIK